jgi:ATP-dependent Zn protease
MTQQQPVDYASWQTIQPKPRKRRWIAWILFIGLALIVFALLNKTDTSYTRIPFSEFESRLKNDRVRQVTLEGDNLVGSFRNAETISGVTSAVREFRVMVPPNMNSDWRFVQWLLDNRGAAVVDVDNGSNLLVNILVPLIPWFLIFLFIWYFVFRQLRIQSQRPPAAVYLVPPPPGTPPAPASGVQT